MHRKIKQQPVNKFGEALCSNCQDTNAVWVEDRQNGNYVCSRCGLCDGQIYDDGPERRQFADSSVDHRRTSVVDQYLDFAGSSTMIGNSNGRLNKLQKRLHGASMDTLEKNIQRAMVCISRLGSTFRLSGGVVKACKDLCALYYRESHKLLKKTVGQKNVKNLCVAIYGIVCARKGVGKNTRLLCLEADVTEKNVNKHTKLIRDLLSEHHPNWFARPQRMDFVEQFAKDLSLPFKFVGVVGQIVKSLEDEFESSRPSTIAAACVHIAATKYPGDISEYYSIDKLALFAMLEPSTIHLTIDKITGVIGAIGTIGGVVRNDNSQKLDNTTKKRRVSTLEEPIHTINITNTTKKIKTITRELK